jgi:hypothetical protein
MAIPLLIALGAGLLSGVAGSATEALLEKFYSASEDEPLEEEEFEDEEEEP